MLALLLSVSALNAIDRQIVNVLVEPVRHDLGLSDTQIGLMTGVALALFYAAAALPIAWLADRRSRPAFIASCVGIWSVFTAMCGLAQNFLQLFAARVLVGIGEAGSAPASHAFLTDTTPRAKRAWALSFVAAGPPIGALLVLALGGITADLFGWRWAFVLAGMPGLALAALFAWTIAEPSAKQTATTPLPFSEALRALGSKRSFWLIAAGSSLLSLTTLGFGSFFGSLLVRAHAADLVTIARGLGHMFGADFGTLSVVGGILAYAFGAAGAAGAFLGGWLCDRLRRKDETAFMIVPAAASAIAGPLFVAAALAPNAALAHSCVALGVMVAACATAPVLACAQSIVPPNMRATASAALFLIMSVLSQGAGPLAVGLLSDWFGNVNGLRLALVCVSAACPLGAVVFWSARRAITREFEG